MLKSQVHSSWETLNLLLFKFLLLLLLIRSSVPALLLSVREAATSYGGVSLVIHLLLRVTGSFGVESQGLKVPAGQILLSDRRKTLFQV